MKAVVYFFLLYTFVLVMTASCSSGPSIDRYQDQLEGYLQRHEDLVLTDFGKPDEILRLSNGTRALVYNKLPWMPSPITADKNLHCRTVFRINRRGLVRYYQIDGTFCVR